jgi:hypothetical protein
MSVEGEDSPITAEGDTEDGEGEEKNILSLSRDSGGAADISPEPPHKRMKDLIHKHRNHHLQQKKQRKQKKHEGRVHRAKGDRSVNIANFIRSQRPRANTKEELRQMYSAGLAGLVVKRFALECARRGDLPRLRKILARHPDLGSPPDALRAAVRFKHKAIVLYLLDELKVDVRICNSFGTPILFLACAYFAVYDDGEMLRLLIDHGAGPDVHTVNDYGQNILFWAAAGDFDKAVVYLDLLAQLGANVLHRDNVNASLLHHAVLFGDVRLVKWTLEHGGYTHDMCDWLAELNIMDKIGILQPQHGAPRVEWRAQRLLTAAHAASPLGVAVLHKQENCARVLMGHDVPPDVCEILRRSLLEHGCKDLRLVARAWPQLIVQWLDVFAEPIRKEEDGFHGTSYDVQVLFGSPTEAVIESPMLVLWETQDTQIFEHDLVKLLVAMKWSLFARGMYDQGALLYLLLVVSFLVGFVSTCAASFAFRCLCWATCFCMLITKEVREVHTGGIARFLRDAWSWLRFASYMFLWGMIHFDAHPHASTNTRGLWVATLMLMVSLQGIEYIMVWSSAGAYIVFVTLVLQVVSPASMVLTRRTF